MTSRKTVGLVLGLAAAIAVVPASGAGAAVYTEKQVGQILRQAANEHDPKVLNQLNNQQVKEYAPTGPGTVTEQLVTMVVRTTTKTLKTTRKDQNVRAGCEVVGGGVRGGAFGLTYKKKGVNPRVVRDLYESARIQGGGEEGFAVAVKARGIPKNKIKMTVATVCMKDFIF